MMDCKCIVSIICFSLLENIDFRWHQIILWFGFDSVIFRFDNQLNDEIELPLNLIRTSGKFNIPKTVFLGANQEKRNDTFFKVKSGNSVKEF
jgi:hypothetical protein